MSKLVFPELPGVTWKKTRIPVWKSLVQQAVSGRKVAAGLVKYPLYRYSLEHELLRSTTAAPELQTFLGFFNQVSGRAITWLYLDPDDSSVTGQVLGTGDGETQVFYTVRTLGGFTEPVQYIKTLSGTLVYLNGVLQSAYTLDLTTGMITFTTAPGVGVVVSADFSWRWECRFLEDETEFERLMLNRWKNGKIEFETEKVTR